jgi:hypothetical protein
LTEDIRATNKGEAAARGLEHWVAPALTDLGSFEELTQLGVTGTSPDAEGLS